MGTAVGWDLYLGTSASKSVVSQDLITGCSKSDLPSVYLISGGKALQILPVIPLGKTQGSPLGSVL